MRHGDDPRDIYWRKSTQRDRIILRERGRETRPDCHLIIDNVKPANADESFGPQFEKRIRDIASRAVAHIKRSDGVVVSTPSGERVRGDKNLGSGPGASLPRPLPRCGRGRGVRAESSAPRGGLETRDRRGGSEARVRFGFVHRVMTDALAALGVLALVFSGQFSRWVSGAILIGLVAALSVRESWQRSPAFRHLDTVALLGVLVIQIVRGGILDANTSSTCSSSSRPRSRSSASRRGRARRTTSRSSSSRSCT